MPATYNITALKSQTVMEISLQEYGSYDGVKLILEDNPQLALFIGQPLEGKSIAIRFDSVIDKVVKVKYDKGDIKPANVSYYISVTGGKVVIDIDNLDL